MGRGKSGVLRREGDAIAFVVAVVDVAAVRRLPCLVLWLTPLFRAVVDTLVALHFPAHVLAFVKIAEVVFVCLAASIAEL